MGMEVDIIRAGHILRTTSDWSKDISGSHFPYVVTISLLTDSLSLPGEKVILTNIIL